MESSRTIEQKRDIYLQEIARRTPPQSQQEEFLRNVYRGLLDDIEWFLIVGGSLRTEVPELTQDLEIETSGNC